MTKDAERAPTALDVGGIRTVARRERHRRMALVGVSVVTVTSVGVVGRAWIPDLAHVPVSGSNPSPPIIEPAPCPENAQCAARFMVGSTTYSLSCGAVRPNAVSDDVIAAGTYRQQQTEVRSINGVSPDVLVAVGIAAGFCGDDDAELSRWGMAFPEDSQDDPAQHDAVCAVVVDEQRALNNC